MNIKEKIAWRIKKWKRHNQEKQIPPYEEKRNIILSYKKKYQTNILVETGTFLGDTIDTLRHDFKLIISFELSEDLAGRAAKRFEGDEHIQIVHGDSGKAIGSYLGAIMEPCLFWLDGHYSSEFFIDSEYYITAKGEKNTPIIEELEAILKHPVKTHVILIDDARCFNGESDYPSKKELKQLISKLSPEHSLKVSRDIIRIVRK
ncbi:MAG: hypothetical protein V4717_15630 [Bacteroidota bacterium]